MQRLQRFYSHFHGENTTLCSRTNFLSPCRQSETSSRRRGVRFPREWAGRPLQPLHLCSRGKVGGAAPAPRLPTSAQTRRSADGRLLGSRLPLPVSSVARFKRQRRLSKRFARRQALQRYRSYKGSPALFPRGKQNCEATTPLKKADRPEEPFEGALLFHLKARSCFTRCVPPREGPVQPL